MKLLVSGSPYSAAKDVGIPVYRDQLGLLLTPTNGQLARDAAAIGATWAMDNDAFLGFTAEKRTKFERCLEANQHYIGCRFVCAPDVWGNADNTVAWFYQWRQRIRDYGYPVALVLQDGIERAPFLWEDLDAVFIGGSDTFKLGPIVAAYVQEAKRRGKWIHMGRVNSRKRIHYAQAIGCDSVDGTGFNIERAKIPKHIPSLTSYTIPMEGFLC